VIDADSKYVKRWDSFVLAALIFTAIVTPYEVAFLETKGDALFWINRLIDLIFVKDMIMNFFMTYYEESEFSGKWVKDKHKIRARYLKSWFVIDLCSILPFDLVALTMSNSTISKFQVFRMIRLLRLLKMVRILKASKIFKRWENAISISYSILSLYKFGMLMICTGHWLACLWGLTGSLKSESWTVAYCDSDGDGFNDEDELLYCNHFILYSASLYFSIMTITSIGYGDISPTNIGEHWVCIFVMFVGSAVWAYVIGNASGIVATMDKDSIRHNQTMDNLNHFVKERNIPQDLSRQLRAYFNFSRDLAKNLNNRELIEQMSPSLRKAVAARNLRWVRKVPWCRHGLSYDIVIEMVQKMEGAAYTDHETLPIKDVLVVMHKGVASRRGRVMLKGSFWGADLILFSSLLKDQSKVISLTMAEILAINRKDLLEVISHFPKDAKLIRKRATWMALQKAMRLVLSFTRQKWAEKSDVLTSGFEMVQSSMTPEENNQLEEFVYSLNPELYKKYSGNDRPPTLLKHASTSLSDDIFAPQINIPTPRSTRASANTSVYARRTTENLYKIVHKVNEMGFQVTAASKSVTELGEKLGQIADLLGKSDTVKEALTARSNDWFATKPSFTDEDSKENFLKPRENFFPPPKQK